MILVNWLVENTTAIIICVLLCILSYALGAVRAITIIDAEYTCIEKESKNGM